MNFKVNSKELEKLLTKIIPAIPSKTPMPILEHFLFELKDGLLTIYATDLEISLKSSLNVASEENFSGLLPAKRLFDLVRSLKDTTLVFQVNSNNTINLSTDKGHYKLTFLDSTDYPEIPSFPNDDAGEELSEVTINGEELKFSLDKTSFAMSKEEIRPAMMGTLFDFADDGVRFVATDGHKLVNLLNKNISHSIENQYIVPERAISVLQKILDEKDVKVYVNNSHISFKLSDIELISRLISQKYPDYKSVIPLENEFTLKVKREELGEAVKRMMLFSTTNTRKVKFSISTNNLEISAEDIDTGSSGTENIMCEYSGEPLEIGFNAYYVHEIVSHMAPEEEIIFKLHSPTKAVIILPASGNEKLDLLMLLMPVRLNS
ncbi:MAG: DNA polymerase III subunit beta [Ignavibacteria bacterium]|nr:MAG: DNA polymerase III subunit beta [Ignavibacteria bacterium]